MTPSRLAAAARHGAWALLPDWRCFACQGADTRDLLGRLSSNDLAPLASGEAITTLFLTPTGRIRHRVLLCPEGSAAGTDSVLAVAESGGDAFPAWIDTYTFAEDCRVTPLDLGVALAFGPAALRLAPDPLARTGQVASGGGVTWMRRDWGGLPVAILAGRAENLAELVREPLGESTGPTLDERALLQLRVEMGEPAAGAELTEERFPLEAGLLAEISFTKGCYTGQEVVARQDTYGKVARRLVGIAFDAPPVAGDELASQGRACVVTSVAPEPSRMADGRLVSAALGYVAAKNSAPGTAVVTASGLAGIVAELPFLPA